MRTKTLLLTAALGAAGMATSMAQVYSVNAVGYVNTTIKPGFNLVSNPLIGADNTIAALFTGVPNATRVYTFNGTGFTTYTYVGAPLNRWTPDGNAVVNPGDGVFVFNPGNTDLTVTFVGEVPQGEASNQTLGTGLSIHSSAVPQEGRLGTASDATTLQFPAGPGDRVFKYTPGTGYSTYTFAGAPLNRWTGGDGSAQGPSIGVGEAFFVNKAAQADWTRNFSVNQ
jgi:hypothetical protein